MFQRHSDITCYFCNSSIPLPRNPRNFLCNHCGCWNRYDDKGEIMSDEPAMHDESLNSRSFSKRASPSKDRLPTMYGKGPFCHTCQTNQMLLVNLMSNYLPPSTSPDYEQRLKMLPEYRESLHTRYPPVCESCLPAVEDEIRKKDSMARTQALGGWLKETKGKASQRRVSGTLKEREKVSKELLAWRIRGCLWVCTLAICISGYLSAVIGYQLFRSLFLLQPILPIFVFLSLLWTAWDPTYSALRKAQMQGKDVRIRGKRKYNYLQMVTWASRLVTATLLALHWFHLDYLHFSHHLSPLRARIYFTFSLSLELSVFIASCFVLRIQRPPAIRLVDSKSHNLGRSRSSTPITGNDGHSRADTPTVPPKLLEPDLFSSLTLSSKPIVQQKAPVFGIPSLASSTAPVPIERSEEDEMDWTPTSDVVNPAFPVPPSRKSKSHTADDGSWVRPQRFFAPEQPTGLESLFEKTKLADDVPMADATHEQSRNSRKRTWQSHLERWWWMYGAGFVILSGIALRFWIGREVSRSNVLHAIHDTSDGSFVGDDDFRSSGLYRHTAHSSSNR